jgi:hypothetical protein
LEVDSDLHLLSALATTPAQLKPSFSLQINSISMKKKLKELSKIAQITSMNNKNSN